MLIADAAGRIDGERRVLGDGSVRVTARIAKVGVLPHEDGRRSLRPEELLFAKQTLDWMRDVTLTSGHPNPRNNEEFASRVIGHVAGNFKRDGDWLIADLIVKRADAIEALEAEILREVSVGWWILEEDGPGTFRGEKYDYAYKRAMANHVALLRPGGARTGPECRVLDGRPYRLDMLRRFDAPSRNAMLVNEGFPEKTDASGSKLDAALERAAKEREARNRSGPPVGSVTRAGRVQDGDPNPNDLSEHARATLTQLAAERTKQGAPAAPAAMPAAPSNGPPTHPSTVTRESFKGGQR